MLKHRTLFYAKQYFYIFKYYLYKLDMIRNKNIAKLC